MNYTIVHFAANQNIASASVIVLFNYSSIGLQLPIEIDSWLAFDANGLLLEYDVSFRWSQYISNTVTAAAMKQLNATTAAQGVQTLTAILAQGICATHQNYCNGTNQQYDNTTACLDFLTTQIRFGQAYELGMNTLNCRMVHENMVPFRPSVHCPHIGPSGGNMCVDDRPYQDVVLEPYFDQAPFVPYGYQNADASIAAM